MWKNAAHPLCGWAAFCHRAYTSGKYGHQPHFEALWTNAAWGLFAQGRVICRLADIIDPDQVRSVTLLGQEFPAEK